jgi:cobyrinic acid a,c-diamide synthase
MIAGTGGDCGKTMVALGLAAAWKREGVEIATFKKGPDYIDAAWLSLAAGKPARNLDTWMMGAERTLGSFRANAVRTGVNIIEGNRGLHDGQDAQGTHSSAALAKLLGSPVILVLSAQKMTRTAAAIALGMKMLDPGLNLAGVLLNRVANARQEALVRTAVESETGLSVLGAIPRAEEGLLPSRHMGLVTPQEHAAAGRAVNAAADLVGRSVDLKRLRANAESAVLNPMTGTGICDGSIDRTDARGLRIGCFAGPAFTFYYPENLEAIDRAGAMRVEIDPLKNPGLPPVDALYIGGGFPETHAAQLADNASFRQSVAASARGGLPIWAECGGLMFLARSIYWKESAYPMAGFLPMAVALGNRPVHGYEEVMADRPNPFIKTGTQLRGHEFHYSKIVEAEQVETAFEVRRGIGLGHGRDGIVMNRALASYLHVHSLATPDWIHWLAQAATEYKREKAGDAVT